jgi:hypothetical protein
VLRTSHDGYPPGLASPDRPPAQAIRRFKRQEILTIGLVEPRIGGAFWKPCDQQGEIARCAPGPAHRTVRLAERNGEKSLPNAVAARPSSDQCQDTAEGQCHHHHEAGVGVGQDRSADAAFNAVALMSTNPWSSPPSIFVI